MKRLPNVISALRIAGSIGLLFLAVPAVFCTVIPISVVAAIATFAAVQEGHFIRTKQVFNFSLDSYPTACIIFAVDK